MIRLIVPGSLEFRDVAVRVVGGAVKLFSPNKRESDAGGERATADLHDPFVSEVVSAFSEAFNNVAIHGYRGIPVGVVEIEVGPEAGATGPQLVIRMTDHGHVFDPAQYLEPPEEMPERGMGLFIIRSFMDAVLYQAGPPNVLVLRKTFR